MLSPLLASLLALPAPPVCPSLGTTVAEAQPFRATETPTDERESIQQLLERLRKKREQLLASLEQQVKPLLEELKREVDNQSAKNMASVRERLAALGSAIAPLLVGSLDPGAAPNREATEYSRQLARTLVLIPTTAITDQLLTLAETGSPLGKNNALRVLAVSPEPKRVSPRLLELYNSTSEPEARGTVLLAIAKLGGEENDQVLRSALVGTDEMLRGIALDAIVTAEAAQFADDILVLLRNLDLSASFAFKIAAYYAKCTEIVNKDHVSALIDAATDSRVPAPQRIGILQQLRQWERLIDSRMKRTLKNVEEISNRNVERQAQILLALLGDSGARRALLKPYDEEVEKAGLWTGPYVSRGTVLYEIADYKQALKDFKQAIKLSRDEPRSVPAAFEYAARCSAQLGNLKQAAEYLEKGPIELKQLQALGSEPVFHELRDSRYGKVFRLDD